MFIRYYFKKSFLKLWIRVAVPLERKKIVRSNERYYSFQIQTQKIDIKAESKIGSLDNVKHKPGGGDKKIFNDRDYLRQTGSNVESLSGSGSQVCLA